MADFKARTSIFAIIVLLAGIIGAVSVFLTWMDFFGIATASGWELFRNAYDSISSGGFDLGDFKNTYPAYMPLVVLIFSIGGLLSGLFTVVKPGRAGGGGATVCGVLIFIAAIVYIWYLNDKLISDFVGTGAYIAAAAGVIMLIFGALVTSSKGN